MKMYTTGPDGKIVLKPVSQVLDAHEVQGQLINPPSAQDGGRQLPLPPFTGPDGIFCRYLAAGVIEDGKGRLFAEEEVLPARFGSVRELIARDGVANVKSGFYNDAGIQNLFLNLGCGCIFFEYLPCNTGKVSVDYYGDTLGLRSADITPYHIKAEILQDLNEAFKMLTAEMAKLYD